MEDYAEAPKAKAKPVAVPPAPRTLLKLVLTKHALERLIGGNSDCEVELREKIGIAFAERHFRTVLKSQSSAIVEASFRKAVQAEIAEVLGGRLDVKSSRFVGEVGSEIRKAIKERIDAEVDAEIAKSIEVRLREAREAWDDRLADHETRIISKFADKMQKLEEAIDARVEARLDEAFETRVRVEVVRRLTAAAQG